MRQAYPTDCCGDDELFFANNEGARRAEEQTSLFKSSDPQQWRNASSFAALDTMTPKVAFM